VTFECEGAMAFLRFCQISHGTPGDDI
jgi:hypothetical protein